MTSDEFQNGKSWGTPPVFSYEWQIKDLRAAEKERVRKRMKRKGRKTADSPLPLRKA